MKINFNKLALCTSLLTLLSALVMIITVFVWLVWPYNPVEFKSVKVLTSEVHQGSMLRYEIDYCKYMDIPSLSTRSFVDGVIFTTNSVTTNNPKGCHKVETSIPVPAEISSGVYSLRTVWVYRVNPLREIVITKDSNNFEIIEGK